MAEDKFKRIIGINPLRIDAYYNLGLLYNKQGQSQQAKQVLEHGISLDPDNLNIHYELAKAYKDSGEFNRAEEEFKYVIEHIALWRKKEIDMLNNQLKGLSNSKKYE